MAQECAHLAPIPPPDSCSSPADQSVKVVIEDLLLINGISAIHQARPNCRKWEDVDHRTVHGRNLLPYRPHVLFESILNRPTTLSDSESSTVLPLGLKMGHIASSSQRIFSDSRV
ncbi:MAG: hypothetical protein Q9163_003137 [Psora crenata]